MKNLSAIGRYKVEAWLRSSGQSELFRASDTVLRRTVLLRVFTRGLQENRALYERTQQALVTAADLVHPHIAWVWEFAEEDGYLYSAERYIAGVTLAERLASPLQRHFEWEEAQRYFHQAAMALDFAHVHGTVHGNLGPENLLLSPEYGSILIGFGLNGAPSRLPGPRQDQVDLAWLFSSMLAGKAEVLQTRSLPRHWPLGVPRTITPALLRALSVETPTPQPFPSVVAFSAEVKELAAQPQAPLSPEELAQLQAEEALRLQEEDAARQALEDAARQEALDAARQEIHEQVQRAMDLESGASPQAEAVPLVEPESAAIPTSVPGEIPFQAEVPTEQAPAPDLLPVPQAPQPEKFADERPEQPAKTSHRRRLQFWLIFWFLLLVLGILLAWGALTGRLSTLFTL